MSNGCQIGVEWVSEGTPGSGSVLEGCLWALDRTTQATGQHCGDGFYEGFLAVAVFWKAVHDRFAQEIRGIQIQLPEDLVVT